jgi:hypothetical protein
VPLPFDQHCPLLSLPLAFATTLRPCQRRFPTCRSRRPPPLSKFSSAVFWFALHRVERHDPAPRDRRRP